MADDDGKIKCLLLPLQSGTLLLPNSLVAEIVPAQRHQKDPSVSAGWYIGSIEWRGMTLPLISIESMYETAPREFPAKTSFVVLHRLRDAGEAPAYYAAFIDGIPHFQFLGEESLRSAPGGGNRAFVAHEVTLDGASAVIPDLDAVELQLEGINPIPVEI